MINNIATPIFCSSVSSIDGDLFSDVTAPPIPIVDSVSINPVTSCVNIIHINSANSV